MAGFEERRRSPRVRVDRRTMSVATGVRVRVLDIGLGGVLMASEETLQATTAALRMPLQGGRFSSSVRIRHHTALPDGSVRIGASFEGLSLESRHSLEQFLAKTSR